MTPNDLIAETDDDTLLGVVMKLTGGSVIPDTIRTQIARAKGEKSIPAYTDRTGHYFGGDCPVGMVQVEFVGCDPKTRRGEYGWTPCRSTFLEVYIDGSRFRIDVGNFQGGDGSWRRGLHLNGPFDMVIDKHSVNACDIYSPKLASNIGAAE